MPRKQSPPRSYRAVIDSLRQVWKIEHVPDQDAIWRSGEPEREAFSPARIRVAIWNMCKGAGGILFEHDFRSLCYRSDLILTQEALLSRRSLRTFAERGFETMHAASYRRRDGLRDGVMTVSRVRSLDAASRIVCKYPEPILKTPKAALVKFFRIEGCEERLMVVNLHATLIRSVAGAVEEMEHLLEHLPEHEGPLLLGGDFNTFTPAYFRAVSSVLGRIGLEYVPIADDPRAPLAALDQVFCRKLRPVKAEIDTTVRNSDHFPLLIEFCVVS